MLLNCPECELKVSDKAKACPHCGFPMTKSAIRAAKPKKHLRLPNGFGQISYINGNLRNHYRVMVTVDKDEFGKPICKLLKPQSFFPTYNDAYTALVEYNKNPYDLASTITVKELYEKWTDKYFEKLKSEGSKRTIKSAWAYCTSVYNMNPMDIRARHIKGCIESVESEHIKSRIKSLFNLMLDYALEYEIVTKNYARTFNAETDNEPNKEHIAFTTEEINKLWENINKPHVKLVLIQTYTGFRPQELGKIRTENVDLEKNIIVSGMKSRAGINRTVPIHPLIKNIITEYYDLATSIGSDTLLTVNVKGKYKSITYDMYRHRFDSVKSRLELNPEHRPHDPRKTFVTLAKKYNVDEYAIKRIVGHSIEDITEKTYTERNIEWLQEEAKKIKKV